MHNRSHLISVSLHVSFNLEKNTKRTSSDGLLFFWYCQRFEGQNPDSNKCINGRWRDCWGESIGTITQQTRQLYFRSRDKLSTTKMCIHDILEYDPYYFLWIHWYSGKKVMLEISTSFDGTIFNPTKEFEIKIICNNLLRLVGYPTFFDNIIRYTCLFFSDLNSNSADPAPLNFTRALEQQQKVSNTFLQNLCCKNQSR